MKIRYLACFHIVLTVSFAGFSQFDHKGITIDGSVSYQELNDTLQWKTIISEPNVIIRESNNSFYLAVMSNTYTSVNLYVNYQPSSVKVMHVSYSLGDATYSKTNKGPWAAINGILDEESGKKVYDWKFRDPIIRDASISVDLPKEMETFYEKNKWVSHTMPMGSFREVEFLLSKELVSVQNQIYITYLYKKKEGQSTLRYHPNQLKSVTGDASIDKVLQNGYLPTLDSFDFQ